MIRIVSQPRPTLMLIATWLLLQSPLLAQKVALNHNSLSVSNYYSQGEKQQALKVVLKEHEERYQVRFNYAAKLISNKYVRYQKDQSATLDESLTKLLAPLGLKYEKLSKELVFITEDKPYDLQKLDRRKVSEQEGSTSPTKNMLQIQTSINQAVAPIALDRPITGRVTDLADNSPIPGVNIVVKGTSTGTITDAEGNYNLSISDDARILVFSSIGYETKEVTIGGQSVINLALSPSIEQLSEIVVIGYGEKSRKLLTESIGTVDAEEIQKVPVASADQALQGRVSGVQITNTSGTPGAGVAVRIRGIGTVGNTQPLFVIDGVPVGSNSSDPTTNPLSTINPNDIESISVLKDASAAAVYGVRAANGVVLITTKRGKLGKPTISFDGYYGVQQLPELYNMNNTAAQIALIEDAQNNYNVQNGFAAGGENFLELHPDLLPGSRYRDINSPWVDNVTNNNAPIQNYNLSVSGANDNLNYYVSAGYFGQESVVNKWDLERFSFRANGDYRINDRVKFGQTFTVSHQNIFHGVNSAGDGFLLANAAQMPPFYEIFDTDNSVTGNRYGYEGNLDVAGGTIGNQNGLNEIRDYYKRDTRLLGGVFAEVMLIPGLTFKSQASVDLILARDDQWNPGHTAQEMGLERAQERRDSRSENVSQIFTNTLTYENTFGDHSINVLAGIEYQKISSTSLSGRAENFLSADPDFYQIVANGQDAIDLGGGASENSFVGYIGRLSYDFRNKYLFTATVRRDGTSRFSPEDNRRWGTFPSFSAAWRVGEEDFFTVPFISDLKIRGSWGQLGNDATTSFPHIFRISANPDYGLGGNNTLQAPAPINFVNESIIWETVETLDAGIDVSFFNDKLSLLATYYQRTTKDFLINLPLPRISGFNNAPANVGEVRNTGIELELGYNTVFNNGFSLGVSGNLTTINNELVSITDGISEFTQGEGYRTAVGFPIGYFYGYKTDGLYQNDAEAANALEDVNSQGAQPGDIRFVDTNGPASEDAPEGQLFSGESDGVIDPNDRAYLGKTIPDFFYGLNINAGFRNFDLSILFQGVEGVQLYNQFRRDAESMTGGIRAEQATTQNRWTGPNTSNDMPRAVATDPNDNNRFSDRWIEDGDFLRLRNIQLGYTLPETVTDKINLRFYVTATNLLTITPYTGPDPEVFNARADNTGSQLEAGTDRGNIPQTRMFQLGVQARF
ncbi:SusC/RagA family TonB-linked outer membrane protein [Tunicatimonas pelagia]|uniref:SusC/RagA family TonB-linked outer membrane protein n=1 Tax=Tunicatimonas pelagia TaxID=931531 RepID=UPI002666CA68|nr:TonB-dependent receptor [Tunicatimonas pelagia]WKN44537.1 TonB-dependent receptor [Tunicatimonas pelagia]